jgi:hypothetical protein
MVNEETLRRALVRIAKEDHPVGIPGATRAARTQDPIGRYCDACWYAEHVLAGGDVEAQDGYYPRAMKEIA